MVSYIQSDLSAYYCKPFSVLMGTLFHHFGDKSCPKAVKTNQIALKLVKDNCIDKISWNSSTELDLVHSVYHGRQFTVLTFCPQNDIFKVFDTRKCPKAVPASQNTMKLDLGDCLAIIVQKLYP